MKNANKQSTGYQYKTADGMQFSNREDREKYQDMQMEKKQLQQEEQYRDNIDQTPNWMWPDEDHMC